MKNWYALYTKAHKEQQVRDLLLSRGFEVFLPQVRVFSKGRVMQSSEPLFPCYLFIKFDIYETGLYAVQWTQGLRSVVSFCSQPAAVDEAVMAYIQKRVSEDIQQGYRSRFRVGDPVRVCSGPLRDLPALFDGPLSAAGRVRVLLTILGQQTRCAVDEAWLQRLA